MLFPFCLISASLKQLSRDILNETEQIWRHIVFVKLRISKNSLEEDHGQN